MLEYKKITLSNGLRFLYHEDRTTPMVALNVLYDVGARDEDKERTGFAHLFEHLMFGGSINIPEYDTPLQMAGGENNTRDRERKLLKKVEQSLASIESGDYGWCEETGEPIGIPRLLARPTANLSLEAQERRELRQKLFGD